MVMRADLVQIAVGVGRPQRSLKRAVLGIESFLSSGYRPHVWISIASQGLGSQLATSRNTKLRACVKQRGPKVGADKVLLSSRESDVRTICLPLRKTMWSLFHRQCSPHAHVFFTDRSSPNLPHPAPGAWALVALCLQEACAH